MRVFLDCDGVLAAFDTRATEILGVAPNEYEARHGTEAFWDALHTPDFYVGLPLMADARALWDGVVALTGCEPTILTATPKAPKWDGAASEKRTWAARHFPTAAGVLTCAARDKASFCSAGDILIDDRPKYAGLWVAKGGTFIVHTSAEALLAELAGVLGSMPVAVRAGWVAA